MLRLRWMPVFSLRLSLFLFVVVPLIVVLGGLGASSLHHLEHRLEIRMQEEIELIARAIRAPLERALERKRAGSLSQTLSSVFEFGRVYGAYVYDEDGQRIAASGPPESMARSQLVELAADGDRVGTYQSQGDREVFSYFVPLSDSVGRNLGLLQLTRAGSDFRDDIQRLRFQGGLILLSTACVLSLLVLAGHQRLFGRSVRELVSTMSAVASGERGSRAALTGPHEMRELARGMNTMLDSIERSQAEIARHRDQQASLERELQQSQKMAAIGQLAAGVAHELGSPLSLIAGMSQRLLRRQDVPEDVAQGLRRVRQAVSRMETIVRQLLDFGRKNPLQRRWISLERLGRSALGQVMQRSDWGQAQVEVEGASDLPEVCVDSMRLEQALVNLLHNAVQAAGTDGRVRLQWFLETQGWGYRIEDSGPGIAADIREHLFDPFYTTKPVGQGTGLGLAVAQSAVRQQGGEIQVGTSRELGGASFEIRFAMEGGADV